MGEVLQRPTGQLAAVAPGTARTCCGSTRGEAALSWLSSTGWISSLPLPWQPAGQMVMGRGAVWRQQWQGGCTDCCAADAAPGRTNSSAHHKPQHSTHHQRSTHHQHTPPHPSTSPSTNPGSTPRRGQAASRASAHHSPRARKSRWRHMCTQRPALQGGVGAGRRSIGGCGEAEHWWVRGGRWGRHTEEGRCNAAGTAMQRSRSRHTRVQPLHGWLAQLSGPNATEPCCTAATRPAGPVPQTRPTDAHAKSDSSRVAAARRRSPSSSSPAHRLKV